MSIRMKKRGQTGGKDINVNVARERYNIKPDSK